VKNGLTLTSLATPLILGTKNHIDLNEVQHWVVYPHTIPETEQIHFQITGIYIPENMKSDTLPLNYFSIRGEVLYSSKKEQKVIVKNTTPNWVPIIKVLDFIK
jgi:hypothetical protein